MRASRIFSISSGHKPDYVLLSAALFLLLFGFIALTSASSDIGKLSFDDPSHFLKQQLIKGLLPGIVGFLIGFFIYYRKWKKASLILFIINLFLLVLVFTPIGKEVNGSNRWIDLGSFSFQPSELLKITFVIYLASLFSGSRIKRIKESWKTYIIFAFVSGIVGILIFLQPATTMAIIIIGAGALMYSISGHSLKEVGLQIVATFLLAIIIVGLLALTTPYRLARVAPYWNPIAQKFIPFLVIDEVKNDNFHISQSITAIGSGGVMGVGFGKSTSKYSILPEPMGDSIFAVIGEEFGFIGTSLVILLFLIIIWRGTDLVLKSHDDFARLMVMGFISIIAIQTFIHISANSGILPFTGVPLPFISYGGTSLAVTLTILGIISNVSRHSTLR